MTTGLHRIVLLVAAAAAIAVVFGCSGPTLTEASFTIEGMSCESCSNAITETLGRLEGVESVSADHIVGSATVVFLSPVATAEQLASEIESLGYTVTSTETRAIDS